MLFYVKRWEPMRRDYTSIVNDIKKRAEWSEVKTPVVLEDFNKYF